MRNRYELVGQPITDKLRDAILTVPLEAVKKGSGHGGKGYKDGWIGGLSMARLSAVDLGSTYPVIGHAIEPLRFLMAGFDVFQVMVNRLDSESALGVHRDGLSVNYRFHLPIITNPHVFWWDEITRDYVHMPEGVWHGPMPYSGILHHMANNGSEPRYHLVVDLIPPK